MALNLRSSDDDNDLLILNLVHRNDLMTLLINKTGRAHLDNGLTRFSRILRVEDFVELLERPVFCLDEEEVYDAGTD